MSSPWYGALHTHLAELFEDGATWDEICANTGVREYTARRAYSGAGYPTREQALALLAYSVDNRVLEPKSRVSRREADEAIIALLETGYTLSAISKLSGVDIAVLRKTDMPTIYHEHALQLLDCAAERAYKPVQVSGIFYPAKPETLQDYLDAFRAKYLRVYTRALAKEWGWTHA